MSFVASPRVVIVDSLSQKWPAKGPDEVLDYDVDWTRRLASTADEIKTSTFMLPPASGDRPLIAQKTENDPSRTKVWLSGGNFGDDCGIVNRIVTAGGRTMEQTVRLRIKNK